MKYNLSFIIASLLLLNITFCTVTLTQIGTENNICSTLVFKYENDAPGAFTSAEIKI